MTIDEYIKSPFYVTNRLGSQADVMFNGERITVIVLPKAKRWKDRERAVNKRYTVKNGPY